MSNIDFIWIIPATGEQSLQVYRDERSAGSVQSITVRERRAQIQ